MALVAGDISRVERILSTTKKQSAPSNKIVTKLLPELCILFSEDNASAYALPNNECCLSGGRCAISGKCLASFFVSMSITNCLILWVVNCCT
mgnify:CR=1 FL=1